MVSIIGRRTDWLEYNVPKFSEKGPVDFFDYSYPTNHFWFKLIGPFARLLQHVFWDVTIEGRENVPRDRNFVLMPNHISHADSFFAMGNLWPTFSAPNAIADEKLFRNNFFRKFAKMFNAFPVRKGSKNLNIVKYAIKRVKNGDTMLWYPEGQRHKNPSENQCNPGKLGTGMFAHQIDTPVIPCFLAGSEFVMPVGKSMTWGKGLRSIKVLIRYGPPVPLDDLRQLPPGVETSQKVVNRIIEHIEKLRPQGPYRDQSHR
jgi:1-acyl-sn-glycerol-3-phosphate acyltransferase